VTFNNVLDFSAKELLVSQPTFKLKDGSLASVCQWLLNVFAATIHTWMPALAFITEDVPYCGDNGLTSLNILTENTNFIKSCQVVLKLNAMF
jgi:hypothetical protein